MSQFFIFLKNHWFLWSAFFVLLAAIAFNESRKTIRGVTKISPAEAVNLINHEETVILDLRDQNAFHNGHIIGSFHVLASDYDLMLKKIGNNKNKNIIILGKDDAEVINLGSKLQKSEFTKIYTISGGIMAWKNASLPLTKK